MAKAGIKMTIGGRNVSTVTEGFQDWQLELGQIQKKLGDLTRPFDEISTQLIQNVRRRFDDNTFGTPPFNDARSPFTREARRARGQDPDGPALKATGALKNSISRLASPTKTEAGKQREVLVLRIGSVGVSYATNVLDGGIWEVPVFESPNGYRFINVDKIPGSLLSNEEYWGKQWQHISTYPEAIKSVQVPGRNFLALFPKDEEFITKVIAQWMNKLFNMR